MINISTGGFSSITALEAVQELSLHGFTSFELSGGIYSKLQLDHLLELSSNLSLHVHNYFPPPAQPFVFNLASLNDDIARLSIQHAKNAIKLASKLGSKVYSFHGGFLIDPQVNELGQVIKNRQINNRSKAMHLFIQRINELSSFAQKYSITLLLENNVLSSANYSNFNINPLLMVDSIECQYVMEQTQDNVMMLVDIAHLKVSSKTLDFPACSFLTDIHEFIAGYHLSDNDGLTDSNEPIMAHSWFWPYLRRDVDYITLEVYTSDFQCLSAQVQLLTSSLYN